MFDKQLLKLNGSGAAFAICALFSLMRAGCILAQALSLSLAICGLWEGRAFGEAAPFIATFAFSFLLREALVFAQESYIDGFARKTMDALQKRFLDDMFDCGPKAASAYGTGAAVSLVIDGSDDIAQYIRIAFPKYADCLLIPIALLIALFVLDPISGTIALICLPFIFIFMRLIGMSAKDEANKRHSQFERLSNSFVNKAQGIADLKAFGADGLFAKIIYDTSESFRKITMKTLRVSMLSSAVLDLFATLALAGVAIMLGFRMVEGSVAFLPALTVLVLVPEYFKPIREFGSNYHETLNGSESLRAFTEFSNMAKDPCNHDSRFWPKSLRDDACISIDTAAGRKTAITGPSGAGKTTLLNALAGLANPPKGFTFKIDGKNETSLRNDAWRARVAYVPQDPHIFNASVRENVCLYFPTATDDEVLEVLDALALKDVVMSMPEGIETQLGEGGHGLSGGQLSRLALGRALIAKDRDIILMDEPSAHVDAATEAVLQEAISDYSRKKTCFIVTHSQQWAATLDEEIEILPIQTSPLKDNKSREPSS